MFQKYWLINLLLDNFVIYDSLYSWIIRCCREYVYFRFYFLKVNLLLNRFLLFNGVDVLGLLDFFDFLSEDKLLFFL